MLRARDRWQVWLKVALGIGLLLLAFRAGLQTDTLRSALLSVHPGWALAALALVVLGALGKAARWALLLSGVSPGLEPQRALGPLLTGQAFNMIAWVRMGDLVRVWLLSSQMTLSMPAVAATLVVENVFDLIAYGSLALLLSANLVAIPSAAARLPLMMAVALVGAVALALLVYRGEWVVNLIGQRLTASRLYRVEEWLHSVVTALQPLKQGRRFWPILLLTIFIWASAWLTNLWLFNAFSLPLPPAAGLLVLVLIIIGVSPGLMPTNIGPFYFLTVLALQQYAVNSGVALAYAALLHALVTSVPLIGAAIHLADQWRRSGQRPRLTPPLSWNKP